MNVLFKKEVAVKYIRNILMILTKIKNFILEQPPGFYEYRQAILSKDENFNYLENEYFKRHILPYFASKNTLNTYEHVLINPQQLLNHSSVEILRINPVTGLPMIGAYDSGGNPFGFNYNQSFHYNNLNSNSNFINLNRTLDYWK